MNCEPLICIVGPTASGKSDVAEICAALVSGVIVSVDSMQVYKGMDIGTAKVLPENRNCPYYMIDICEATDDFSVRLFQDQARRCIDALLAEHIRPILCGGTGLYLNSVIDNMDFPAKNRQSDLRLFYEDYANKNGNAALFELLLKRDPKSAALIHPNNTRRVAIALSLLDDGTSYEEVHAGLHERQSHYRACIWGLSLNRDHLYERINTRVDDMFNKGLIKEVKTLFDSGLTLSHSAAQAIGYKEIISALSGLCTMDEARETIKKRSRNYAKRQISWFKHDQRIRWINLEKTDYSKAAEYIVMHSQEVFFD